jgi:hypothetical protein
MSQTMEQPFYEINSFPIFARAAFNNTQTNDVASALVLSITEN